MAKLKTGRHTSAQKANRQAIKRTAVNNATRSKIKNIMAKVEAAVKNKDKATAATLLKTAFSLWDKASKKNVIHFNAASNQKARLSKLVHSIS